MKNILTPEQSQRLIELGVDKKLASESDIVLDEQGNVIPYVKDYMLKPNEYCAEIQFADEDYPSVRAYVFTIQDLLSILPKKITDRRYIYTLEMGAWNTEDDGWYIKYVNDMDNDILESYQEAEELIDAIYSMIVWLKDNEKLVWL